jgi:hypothetical protein
MNTRVAQPITIATAPPRHPSLHVEHHGVQNQGDKPGDQDHQQDVPHPEGELAQQVDKDHHAAGGEDRRQRNAACQRGGSQARVSVSRTYLVGPGLVFGLGLALFEGSSLHTG